MAPQSDVEAPRVHDAVIEFGERLGQSGGWHIDLEAGRLSCSPGMALILGRTCVDMPDDVLTALRSVTHPDDLHLLEQAEDALVTRAIPWSAECRLVRPDGSIRWIWTAGEPQTDAHGRVVALVGFVQDITEKKQALAAQVLSEEKFRTAFRTSPDAVNVNRLSDGLYYDVNEGFTELTGYTARDVEGKTSSDISIWNDPADRDRLVAGLRTGRAVHNLEAQFRRKDGTLTTALMSAQVIDIGGEPCILSVTRDISELRRASESLRQSEARYRTIAESVGDVVWVLDPLTLRFLYVSPSVERLRGFTPEEVLAEPMDAALTPDGQRLVRDLIARRVVDLHEDEQPVGSAYTEEIEQPCKDGSTVWTEVVTTYRLNQETGLPEVHGVTRDITERRRIQEDLRESERRLRGLLDQSPISIWESDFSAVHQYFDALRQEGVTDWAGHFDAHPEAVLECVERIRVLNVNQSAVELMAARNKGELIRSMTAYASEESLPAFRDEMIALADGRTSFKVEFATRNLKGEARTHDMYLNVVPGHEGALDRVLMSFVDTTDQQRIKTEILSLNDDLERREAERTILLERLADTLTSVIDVIGNLTEVRDPYTAGHQRRVAELASAIAGEMGMSDAEVAEIRVAALMHDVGKISVPAEILSRPRALTPVEFSLVAGHAEAGYRIINSAHVHTPIAELVYQHHERCDGSGYPRGLTADDLLDGSKVLMVADVVEAMSSHRPYRAALGEDAALAEIESGAGSRYDSGVCESCIRLFRERGFAFAEV